MVDQVEAFRSPHMRGERAGEENESRGLIDSRTRSRAPSCSVKRARGSEGHVGGGLLRLLSDDVCDDIMSMRCIDAHRELLVR